MNLSRRSLLAVALAAGLAALGRCRLGPGAARDPGRLRDLQPGQPRPQGEGHPGARARRRRRLRALGPEPRLQQGAGVPQRRLPRLRLHRRRGGADRQDQRQPDQVRLRLLAAGMDGARHPQGHRHRGGRRPEGQARRGHPRHRPAHLPRPLAPRGEAHRARREARAPPAPRRPHGPGAGRRGRLGRARPPDGRGRDRGRRRALPPQRRRQHLGRAQRARSFRQGEPGPGDEGARRPTRRRAGGRSPTRPN